MDGPRRVDKCVKIFVFKAAQKIRECICGTENYRIFCCHCTPKKSVFLCTDAYFETQYYFFNLAIKKYQKVLYPQKKKKKYLCIAKFRFV